MPDTPLVSFVIPCKGRLEHLKQTLPALNGQDGCEVIVVDYDCPDGTAAWVNANFPEMRVEKVENRPNFSASKARNAGLARACGDWVFFLDADVLVSRHIMRDLLVRNAAGSLPRDRYYVFGKFRKYGVFGSNLAPRDAVVSMGGYDENYQGYGGEDRDYFTRLNYSGLKFEYLDTEPANIIAHTPKIRATYHAEQNGRKSLAVGRLYNTAKRDLMKSLHQVNLPPKLLAGLYRKCVAEVERVMEGGEKKIVLKVNLPPDPLLFEGDNLSQNAKRTLYIETRFMSV